VGDGDNAMTDEDRDILERHGWTVECESPCEVSHEDGSFARGRRPVDALVWFLKDEEKDESDYDRGYHDGEQGNYGGRR